MHRPVVLCGSSHPIFGTMVAERLGIGQINVVRGKYANGETQFELRESVHGADVYIVQTNFQPVNDMLVELLIIAQTCRYAAAHRIIAVMPFFPYARQDKMKSWLQPITSKLVANMLTSAGVDHVLTMDLHTPQLQGFFDIPCDNLNSQVSLVLWIERNLLNWRDAVIVAPDSGGIRMAASVSGQLGLQLAMFHKQRRRANEISTMTLVGDVRGKMAIIVDDMIDTAETICLAAQKLHDAGAKKIYAYATHGIFSHNSAQRLLDSHLELVICTNTLPIAVDIVANTDKFRVLDVTNIFAKYVKSLQEQRNFERMARLTIANMDDTTREITPKDQAVTQHSEETQTRRTRQSTR